MLRLIIILVVLSISHSQDYTNVDDVHILSELSLEKLLALKRSFEIQDNLFGFNVSRTEEDEDTPLALALQSKKNPKERGGGHYPPSYHYESSQKKDKVNIQTIFQVSVTTLAFLAFGAYLLCLLIQAVKGKADYYNVNPVVTQVMAAYLSNKVTKKNVQRLSKNRRQKRPQNGVKRRPQPIKNNVRPNNNINIHVSRRPKREVETEITEEMYDALVSLSESYTKYHTVDYLKYNNSLINYY